MTWEELKEEAKKMGCYIFLKDAFCMEFSDTEFSFYKNGDIIVNHDTYLKRCVSYDQMLAIMKALQ